MPESLAARAVIGCYAILINVKLFLKHYLDTAGHRGFGLLSYVYYLFYLLLLSLQLHIKTYDGNPLARVNEIPSQSCLCEIKVHSRMFSCTMESPLLTP